MNLSLFVILVVDPQFKPAIIATKQEERFKPASSATEREESFKAAKMKPEEADTEDEVDSPITTVVGDVIGDTAYSERFVLKILLKIANLNTLRDELKEKSFEEELCTLWDMAAERDVVIFLLQHDFLKLVNFALSSIESPRIIEIIIGIIGNMSCHKETAAILLMKDSFLTSIIEYIGSDDSLVLIQVIRLVSTCLYLATDQDLNKLMNIFKDLEYCTPLYFMLKNSSNKELLVSALENFNAISSYYNTDRFREDLFQNFVHAEALESLASAFIEVTVAQQDSCETEELERVLVITMQITLILVGFELSKEIFADSKGEVLRIVTVILSYYENKLVNQQEIDADLVDIIESTNTVVHILVLSEVSEPEQYFSLSFNIWKALNSITASNGSTFEEVSDELRNVAKNVKVPLSVLICSYLEKCSENNLAKALDELGREYDEILDAVNDNELKAGVANRAKSYRSRLEDNVDSM